MAEKERTSKAQEEAPEPAAPESFETRLRYVLRQYRFPLSSTVLVLSAVLCVIALAAWTPLINDPPFSSFVPGLKGGDYNGGSGTDWTLLMGIVGGLLALISGYLVGVYLIARQKFDHLMKTKSKAEFLRNVAEVEDLLWDLTPQDEIRLVQKKQEFKIRT